MGLWDGSVIPAREQFDYWQDIICREFVPLSAVRTGHDFGFASKVETSPLGSLNRASIVSKAQITRRGAREIAASDEAYFFVNLQMAGRCLANVGGVSSVVNPGEFMVVDTAEPYEFEFSGDWRMLSFRVDHRDIEDYLSAYRDRLGVPVGPGGVGSAVTSLMRVLDSLSDELSPVSVSSMVHSFESAVVAALAAAPGLSVDAVGAAPLRAAVLDHVRRNLGDAGLSVEQVSRTFSISVRTLHGLFEGAEDSFSRTVRNLRLQRAHDVLSDPSCTVSVTELAQFSGFYDPSAFTRAFRRRFGVSPVELRRSVTARTAK
ncbi:helix-turn-helix domain-containing protein [Paenarthrobacter sp. NPDC090517]|uniref:AraC-like ligand-binding domain-containing protein n=1 Tax=Paenarthrobacter sp. NPDC090517 TaxID=3364381 RepID=UPI0037FC5C51